MEIQRRLAPFATLTMILVATLLSARADDPMDDHQHTTTRPWAPPENQQVTKNYKHPTVVTPPRYDTNEHAPQTGQLLSYRDAGTPGNVLSPMVLGFSGWLDFKFLFGGRNLAGQDRIYAVVAY